MKNVRRHFLPGDMFVATCVTKGRAPILLTYPKLFLDALSHTESALACTFEAWVLLPDHVHFVVSSGSADPSRILKRFKEKYLRSYLSRLGLRSGRIWQQRFYDHIVRDEEDWRRQINYIHGNPVKHGFVNDPYLWEYSTLRSYFEKGMYERGWGKKESDWSGTEVGEKTRARVGRGCLQPGGQPFVQSMTTTARD